MIKTKIVLIVGGFFTKSWCQVDPTEFIDTPQTTVTSRLGRGTNSHLIFTKHKFVMLSLSYVGLTYIGCWGMKDIIFLIGGVKVVFLNICLFNP